VIYLALALWFGLAAGIVGRIKGSSFFLWLVIGAVLPVLGLLAALIYRSDRDEVRRQCPGCGKVVKLHDALCMRCGTELEFPDVAIEPESAALQRR
jgi:membrane protein implicated in regulation of membrane protease activity